MPPQTSIIITCYNYGEFIAEAIESALAQSSSDREIIVVDDGSTDNSVDIARRYDVRLEAQPNRGVARARNSGLALAKGRCVVFLDADDRIHPEFLRTCEQALASAPRGTAYAYTGYRMFGDLEQQYAGTTFCAELLLSRNFLPVTCLVYRDALMAVGGFDPRWRAWEDWELWIRMLNAGHVGHCASPAPLLEYRRHGTTRNSLSTSQKRALRGQLVLQYPALYARQALRHPLRTAGQLAYATLLRRQTRG